MLKRIYILLLAGVLSAFGTLIYGAQPTASSVVAKMTAAMKKSPSLEATFTVWNNGNSSSGSMTIAGQKFHLSTPQMKVWFDGKTQWAYSPSARECNVTEPTPEEVAQTNPLSILSAVTGNFNMKLLKSSATEQRIELTPKRKSADFASAILVVNPANGLPREITVKDSRGTSTTIRITSIKAGKQMAIGAFRFNPAQFRGVEVVDLR